MTRPHFANLKHCIKFNKYPCEMELSANEEVIKYFKTKESIFWNKAYLK